MLNVAEQYLLPIAIALLIGLAIGFVIFRARTRGERIEEAAVETAPVEATPDEPDELSLPPAAGPPDNLQMMKGIGPQLAARLAENGVTRFDQLAALSEDQVAALDQRLGNFNGRLTRDRVVEQAGYLARGDREAFEAKFGNLGGA